jgi:hypothetical protein
MGRATSVATRKGQTIVTTVPATLLEAVPQGSIQAALTSGGARVASVRARAAAKQRFSCTGSASAAIAADASFETSVALNAEWTVRGGLQSASLTANAKADGSVSAEIAPALSCSLARTPVLQFNLPTKRLLIDGLIPIVITSQVTVFVDAQAKAAGAVNSSLEAGFSATAGIGWTNNGGFAPIGSFDPSGTSPRPIRVETPKWPRT